MLRVLTLRSSISICGTMKALQLKAKCITAQSRQNRGIQLQSCVYAVFAEIWCVSARKWFQITDWLRSPQISFFKGLNWALTKATTKTWGHHGPPGMELNLEKLRPSRTGVWHSWNKAIVSTVNLWILREMPCQWSQKWTVYEQTWDCTPLAWMISTAHSYSSGKKTQLHQLSLNLLN